MTGAERQRRYLARLLRGGKTASKPAEPNDEIAALKAEIARLKAKIRDKRETKREK
jgi:HAMP domain-containing protein